jgi:hypothetical protein
MPTNLFIKELDKYPQDFLNPYTSNPLPTSGYLYDLYPNAITLADNIFFDTNKYEWLSYDTPFIHYEPVSFQYYFKSESDFSKFQLHLKSLYDKYTIARKQALLYYKLQRINNDF